MCFAKTDLPFISTQGKVWLVEREQYGQSGAMVGCAVVSPSSCKIPLRLWVEEWKSKGGDEGKGGGKEKVSEESEKGGGEKK